MNAAVENEVVRETLAKFPVAVEGGEGLAVSILPGFIPCHGISRTMFLLTNRFSLQVLDLHAEARLVVSNPDVRPGVVTFRQRSLLPGEVSFGTIEIATAGAAPGEHELGLAISYRLAHVEEVRNAA
jgi:hypothetical protein